MIRAIKCLLGKHPKGAEFRFDTVPDYIAFADQECGKCLAAYKYWYCRKCWRRTDKAPTPDMLAIAGHSTYDCGRHGLKGTVELLIMGRPAKY